MVVLWVFNELAALLLGAVTGGKRLGSARSHLTLLGVSIAAVAAPWIAALGSGRWAAALPDLVRQVVAIAVTALSQAGLWAEVYLITGWVLDALHGGGPSSGSTRAHPLLGLKKGMIYSAVFMTILQSLGILWAWPRLHDLARSQPLIMATLFGALAFPLAKTLIETFDGSRAFFRRLGRSYRDPVLYLRGAVVGLGVGYGLTHDFPHQPISSRAALGFVLGAIAYAGVNLVRDGVLLAQGRGRWPGWRLLLVNATLGGLIGAALWFYFDAAQVQVVADKFERYIEIGGKPQGYDTRPLLSKWGYIDLGTTTGGVSLLFDEALDGVISWWIPAWLFALNGTFMAAAFRKETAPIRNLFSAQGLVGLTENMISVFRWGLWMAPIIKSFLRPMGDPTWYNQDGAIRTLLAIGHDLTQSPSAFRAWSLQVFIALLASDVVRIAIWLDHMGLRVATLVNLSFQGMDKLDSRLARFVAPRSTARCIPEAVKRFTTWAPLLIPFYIPRGKDWDTAWDRSQVLIHQSGASPITRFLTLPRFEQILILVGSAIASTAALRSGSPASPASRP